MTHIIFEMLVIVWTICNLIGLMAVMAYVIVAIASHFKEREG